MIAQQVRVLDLRVGDEVVADGCVFELLTLDLRTEPRADTQSVLYFEANRLQCGAVERVRSSLWAVRADGREEKIVRTNARSL